MGDCFNEQKLLAALSGLVAKSGDKIELELSVGVTVQLIAQLQLALRHPTNTGKGAQQMRVLVKHIIDGLAEIEPDFAMMHKGFDPQCDVQKAGG